MTRWTALVLASLSWLFAFRHFISPDPFLQWGLIGLALLLAAVGFGRAAADIVFSPRYLLLLIPLGIALWIAAPDPGPELAPNHFNLWYDAAVKLASSPYRPALIVLAVGIALAAGLARPAPLRFLAPAGVAATLVGCVLLVQSPAFWISTAWTARNPEMPAVGALVYPVLKWLGTDSSFHNGVLYVRTMRDTHEFPLTWEHLAAYPLLAIWLGGAFLLALDRGRRPLRRTLPVFSDRKSVV